MAAADSSASRRADGRGGGILARGAILAPRGWRLELAATGRVVLVRHAGRDAAALAHRQAVLFRPGPDITRTLPAGRRTPRPA